MNTRLTHIPSADGLKFPRNPLDLKVHAAIARASASVSPIAARLAFMVGPDISLPRRESAWSWPISAWNRRAVSQDMPASLPSPRPAPRPESASRLLRRTGASRRGGGITGPSTCYISPFCSPSNGETRPPETQPAYRATMGKPSPLPPVSDSTCSPPATTCRRIRSCCDARSRPAAPIWSAAQCMQWRISSAWFRALRGPAPRTSWSAATSPLHPARWCSETA